MKKGELRTCESQEVEVMSIVVGGLGSLSKKTVEWLGEVGIDIKTGLTLVIKCLRGKFQKTNKVDFSQISRIKHVIPG